MSFTGATPTAVAGAPWLAVDAVVEMFFTPGSTLESSAEDPRLASRETLVPDVTPARTHRSLT